MLKKKIDHHQEQKEKLAAKTMTSSDVETPIPEAMKKVGINTVTGKNNAICMRFHG